MKYTVFVNEVSIYRYHVEAEDEATAREMGLDLFEKDESEPWNREYEDTNVEIES